MSNPPPTLNLSAFPVSDWSNSKAVSDLLSRVQMWIDRCYTQRRDIQMQGGSIVELLSCMRKQEQAWKYHRISLASILQYRRNHSLSDSDVGLEAFLLSHPDTLLTPPVNTVFEDLTLAEAESQVPKGLYVGWKGHIVLVTGYRKDSESTEARIDYVELTVASGAIVPSPEPWSRLLSEWMKPVDKNGYKGPRFRWLAEGSLRYHNTPKTDALDQMFKKLDEDPASSHLFTRRLDPT